MKIFFTYLDALLSFVFTFPRHQVEYFASLWSHLCQEQELIMNATFSDPPPFRVYVRTVNGAAMPDTVTVTWDATIADHAINELIERACLHGEPVAVVAQYKDSVYFTFDFADRSGERWDADEFLLKLGRVDWLRNPSLH